MDPKNSSPNWLLCCDIESSIETEFSVFVAGLCRSMQFSNTTCSLGLFMDFVATDFDRISMQSSCSRRNRNVLCSYTKFVATSSFYTLASGNCRDKHFSFQLVYSIMS